VTSHTDKEFARLLKVVEAHVRESRAKDERIAELERQLEPKPESWLPLETVAIDCDVKPGTLRAWGHKGLIKWKKKEGRYSVEVNSVIEHVAFAGRTMRGSA
jgi:hypothetical protein